MSMKHRIVLDTNCLISSLSRHGQYYPVWKGFQTGQYILCVSTDILEEYAEKIAEKMSIQVAQNVIHLLLESASVELVNPYLDNVLGFIKKYVNHNILKIAICVVLVFLIFDAEISYIGLKSFYAKIANDFDFDLKQSEYPGEIIENKLFEEDNMLLVYPNMQIAGTKYNNTYIDSLYKNKKMYYFRVFSKN